MYNAQQFTESVSRSSLSQGSKIQEAFLNHCRRHKVEMLVTFIDQQSVKGQIVGFDQESLVIDSRGNQELYFKNCIISIKPVENVQFIFADKSYKIAEEEHTVVYRDQQYQYPKLVNQLSERTQKALLKANPAVLN